MLQLQIKKTQLKAAILCLIHGILGLFCLISFFTVLGNQCRALFFCYFFLYSLGGFTQTVLEYKIPKMDLFNIKTRNRVKYLIYVLLVPVALHVFLAIMWWAKWKYNPLYCMFVVELGLSNLFGILLTFHAFVGFVLYVAVGHAYIKRKYFLITIGGPQNQIIREDNQIEDLLRVRIPAAFVGAPAVPPNAPYNQFDDRHEDIPDIAEIKEEIYRQKEGEPVECPICLAAFAKQAIIGRLKCNHIFHSSCLREWLVSQIGIETCPVCRSQVH